jgi:hypothetical protein
MEEHWQNAETDRTNIVTERGAAIEDHRNNNSPISRRRKRILSTSETDLTESVARINAGQRGEWGTSVVYAIR